MGELLLWLLAATALGLAIGWQLWRRRAALRRIQEAQRQRAAAQAERAEADRVADEQATREARRLAAERAEAERLARQAAQQHAQAERAAAEERARSAAAQAEREAQHLAAQRARDEHLAAQRAEQEHQVAQRAEQQRLDAERAAAERLAAAQAETQHLAAERAAPPRAAAKSAAQTLVLVADDSKVVRIKTGRLLAQHQYQVSYASDGLDAMQQISAAMPDVLVTDVEMPGMDGFELTRHIRGNPQTAQLPVIMITAADDRHREQADAAGVSVLLGKPYRDDELIAHIRLALGHGEAPPQDAARSAHEPLDALA